MLSSADVIQLVLTQHGVTRGNIWFKLTLARPHKYQLYTTQYIFTARGQRNCPTGRQAAGRQQQTAWCQIHRSNERRQRWGNPVLQRTPDTCRHAAETTHTHTLTHVIDTARIVSAAGSMHLSEVRLPIDLSVPAWATASNATAANFAAVGQRARDVNGQ